MSAAVQAIDADIEAIEADIEKNPDPRLAQIDRLRRARVILTGDPAQPAPVMKAVEHARADDQEPVSQSRYIAVDLGTYGTGIMARRAGRQPSPTRLRALAAAHNFLLDKTEPIKTATIHAYLESNGVLVGGTDPVNNLSAILSNDDRFMSFGGRRGWMIKREEAA